LILKQVLDQTRDRLASLKDVENPALESEVLLRYILNLTRAQLYLDLNIEFDTAKERILDEWTKRRLQGEPLSYIINTREFYGLDFFVDCRVLIPRPETELLVEEAIDFCNEHHSIVLADIGCGSGAISVSLAVVLPQVKIYAIDLSIEALEVAKCNACTHGVEEQITFLHGDLLVPLESPVDVLIANLPYVSTRDWQVMASAAFEPRLALEAGDYGLDQLSRLIQQLKGKVNPGGCVLLEIGLGQAQTVTDCLKEVWPDSRIDVQKDLAGIERVIRVIL